MIAGARHWWTWLTQRWGALATQPSLLLFSGLLGAGAYSLLLYFIGPPGYHPAVHVLFAAIFWGLAALVPQHRAHTLLSNLALLTAGGQMVFIAAHTGGIHSPAMVGLTFMVVPALLLLGRRWAFFWLGVVVVVFTVAFGAAQLGWLEDAVIQTPKTWVWAMLDKVLVIMGPMWAVAFHEAMHRRQKQGVARRTAELEATQRALLQLQSDKDEFIASVGHELRTPMNAILGLNGVLQTELANQTDDLHIVHHIRDSTRQLLQLVNDILDFSQLEAGRLQLLETPLHLAQTLDKVLRGFEARAAEKSLRLFCSVAPELPTWVLLDLQRLEQILEKLLDNALKFTQEGSVWLGVRERQGRLCFELEDTGPGIAQEQQPQVFKRFGHVDPPTTRVYGGRGLGLAICERLVLLQGGRIGVRSRPGGGALFWFELALQAAAPPRPAPPPQDRLQVVQPLRILLVDDNAVNRMVAQLVLEKCWPDVLVTQAGSGEAALALLDVQHFDLVLMDVVMPGLDGLETTRRLRRHTQTEVAGMPVLGLTASSLAQERERCLQSGMNDVLAKPMDTHSVQRLVEHLIGRVRHAQAQRVPA